MNRTHHIYSLIIIVAITLSIIAWFITSDYCPAIINHYAISNTEQSMGSAHVKPEQEQFVRDLAREMNITKPFHIRKINPANLQTFGYYNAFIAHPIVARCIPISNHVFLYISEGFFEDLSPEEQRFLIGHELIHLREGHTQYYLLVITLGLICMFLLWFFVLRNAIQKMVYTRIPATYRKPTILGLSITALATVICIPDILGLAYRRKIEWEADRTSVALLQSHAGGIAYIDRIQKEFNRPSHEPYFGLLADHPSLAERKTFLLAHAALHSKESL